MALTSVAEEEFHAVQRSPFHPVQLHSEEDAVSQLGLNLINQVNGVAEASDLGLFTHTAGHLEGIAIGLVNASCAAPRKFFPIVNWQC